jgi:hypothetical protein
VPEGERAIGQSLRIFLQNHCEKNVQNNCGFWKSTGKILGQDISEIEIDLSCVEYELYRSRQGRKNV